MKIVSSSKLARMPLGTKWVYATDYSEDVSYKDTYMEYDLRFHLVLK